MNNNASGEVLNSQKNGQVNKVRGHEETTNSIGPESLDNRVEEKLPVEEIFSSETDTITSIGQQPTVGQQPRKAKDKMTENVETVVTIASGLQETAYTIENKTLPKFDNEA